MSTLLQLKLTVQAQHAIEWPHFAGSSLRGAFGRALRHAACVTRKPDCKGCSLRKNCTYGVVFDPDAPLNPVHPSFQDGLPLYWVVPPSLGAAKLNSGQTVSFKLMLMAAATSSVALIEHTLKAAVENELIRKGCFKLISLQKENIAAPVIDGVMAPANAVDDASQLVMRMQTPLRLQVGGKPVFAPATLSADIFLRAVMRRYLQWCQVNGFVPVDMQGLKLAAQSCRADTSNLHWHDIKRHSGSQNRTIPLGGLMGQLVLRGPKAALQALYPLLQLGQTLHIGKEVMVGLGQYQLGAIEPA
jgi:hypothetical protein